jgi:hypothetical protein
MGQSVDGFLKLDAATQVKADQIIASAPAGVIVVFEIASVIPPIVAKFCMESTCSSEIQSGIDT